MGNERLDINSLAERAGFKSLTALQNKTFDCKDFYDVEKWLFVVGATSSGKTLVALMSYFFERARSDRQYKMLFAVPYRALASQKFEEISAIVDRLGLKLRIVQSTSENNLDDDRIKRGDADIAVIINEKVFMFASQDSKFLSRYNLLVLDEIALNQDEIRGLKTDFILLKARHTKGLRLIAMGTPFYDWREYIEKFNFTPIIELERPIELKEKPQFCNQGEKFSVRRNEIAVDICRKHLPRGDKILIFFNNRQEVRGISKALLTNLNDCLTPWIDKNQCKNYILEKIQADGDDILCGSMVDEDYEAFARGICYHNANMPSTLRHLIERDFASKDGHLKIICSTETLAYGINSNADVVIIPHMLKDKKPGRFLFPNEYMNYAGRAGRLNESNIDQKTVGYVYPVMQFNQKNKWLDLQSKIQTPEVTLCRYFQVQGDYRAFYVLSLFPNDGTGLTVEEIESTLKKLPLGVTEEKNIAVGNPIDKLVAAKLIRQVDEDDEDEPRYALSDVGKNISGFVVLFEDFQKMINDVRDCVTDENFFEVDMFNSIVRTKELTERCDTIIGKQNSDGFLDFQSMLATLKGILKDCRARGVISPALFKKLQADIKDCGDNYSRMNTDFVSDEEFKQLRMLAAILLWRSGECNPVKLFNAFNIYYEQMRRLLEIFCYRLEMINFALEIAPGRSKKWLRSELAGGHGRLAEVGQKLKAISEELSYQPSKELCGLLGIEQCDFYMVQRLRPLDEIFSELMKLESESEKPSALEKQKFIEALKHWRPKWRMALLDRFSSVLKD